ncbi:MAG: GNAT family N-acetyltransferase [Acidimicrobiales bacterium]|jgi:acetyl coenzyme A synthetase (ADP forming)-like protein|nr:GNAT family N-acetyltransferase [Acidimicrobiales bacterium]
MDVPGTPVSPTSPAASDYPDKWEADVVLSDGGTLHLRPIRSDDYQAHRDFIARLSPQTMYFRFFGPRRELTEEETTHFTTVDYRERMAFAAFLGEEMVGVARYERLGDDDVAEVAFVVDDAQQGRGLGTLLLEHLVAAARQQGITRFVAETLPDNRKMLSVFRDAGYRLTERYEDGVVHLSWSIEPTEEATARIESREHIADVLSIRRILAPRSVAVIGASHEPGTIGYHLFLNLLEGGFDGPVYPVNLHARHVASVPTYPTVLDVPDEVDLAVIALPAEAVLDAVEQCARKEVKGLVVVSAGFGETGPVGAELEHRVLAAARGNGMRLVGPNCIGVANSAVGLNATFAPVQPPPGRVAFMSQSGALGIALLEWADRAGLGISSFASIGNKADVSGNDLLQYWEDDDGTDVILMYLESFGNPRKFSRIARRVSQRKPIVAVKSGRTIAGSRAATSHTAAAASPDVAVAALFHQAGVIRVDTLDELLAVAQILSSQPLPAGNRVAIAGNSGGPGILAADACAGAGLDVATLSEHTRAALRDLLGPNAAVGNPVDMIASAGADRYETALQLLLDDPGVDALIVIYTPPLVTRAEEVADAIARVAVGATKPIVANFLASIEPPAVFRATGEHRRIPSFSSPEPAAIALGRVARYSDWRRRDRGEVPDLDDIDRQEARAVVDGALAAAPPEGCWLDADVSIRLLEAYGIPLMPVRRAESADVAAAIAEELGVPVALKAASGALVHKSDVGGLRLDLRTPQQVRDAYIAMQTLVGETLGGIVLQPMAEPGIETIVGVVQDPSFGPLVMFGMGGIATELLADRGFRILPLTDVDAAEMVRSLRASPLLSGYRGSPGVDTEALEELLVRVGLLAGEIPEVVELDLNPVVATADGVLAIDVKVHLRPVEPGHPEGVRMLG